MDEINLTIVGDSSCSTTRAYLVYLARAGLRPSNLWLIDFQAQFSARHVLGTLTRGLAQRAGRPLSFGKSIASVSSEFQLLCDSIELESGFEPVGFSSEWEPEQFARNVEHFRARDFTSRSLTSRLATSQSRCFLYTNGGMVPKEILESDLRFLHVHPGLVPNYRGSDCLLWSALYEGELGASCIVMNNRIDEGSVIARRRFSTPILPSLAPFLTQEREPIAYQALLRAFDPHLRAQTLVSVFEKFGELDPSEWPVKEQDESPQPTFLWMHPLLRLAVMKRVFCES